MMLLKVIDLLALLGATAWFAREPGWDSGLTALAFLGALVTLEVKGSRQKPAESADTILFRKFLIALPSNGPTARFLSEHDIGNEFASSDLQELDQFLHEWDTAEHEFQSKVLEDKRKALYYALKNFRTTLSTATGPAHTPGFLTLGMDDFEVRDRVLGMRDKLNQKASKAHDMHQDLVRTGRQLLLVDG